jgi:2-polyprenyl-3-methyl-5-hydroxy-6-metoxy-1,4-benzoquinol methylase
MRDASPVELGRYVSYWFHRTPRRLLYALSYYKFASKLIGPSKRVLDLGCNEGLGTWVLAHACGCAKGVDFDAEAIAAAQRNFSSPCVAFSCADLFDMPHQQWDAVTSFDVIEHIFPENADQFLSVVASQLHHTGLAVIGTPSLTGQQFASEISRKGHVNVYSHERLEEAMKRHFAHVFLFAANDEVVHTGYLPLAHYLIAVGCQKKLTNPRELL